ncbi:MAG: helix-turn-helix transcriptional regulator [Candidatus Aminicenantes bacterium]|nr:MAG: helix-turn-helix transcriptional regulator [Candidatus Aminicenantes bacterium]
MKNKKYRDMRKKENIEHKKSIRRRFKEFRTAIGKTQTQLAIELNVYQSTITNIEGGKSFPAFPYIYYLYSHYHLSPTWLLTGEGEKFLREKDEVEEPWVKSRVPCHIEKDDSMYKHYVELLDLMRIPMIEKVIMGKLNELKILAKEEITHFKKNQ